LRNQRKSTYDRAAMLILCHRVAAYLYALLTTNIIGTFGGPALVLLMVGRSRSVTVKVRCERSHHFTS
jgi:hypothetical protein